MTPEARQLLLELGFTPMGDGETYRRTTYPHRYIFTMVVELDGDGWRASAQESFFHFYHTWHQNDGRNLFDWIDWVENEFDQKF